jgi:hypothetical protein
MGLLAPSDWQAIWIGPPDAGTASAPEGVPMVRRAFTSRGEVRRARAYVTSGPVPAFSEWPARRRRRTDAGLD